MNSKLSKSNNGKSVSLSFYVQGKLSSRFNEIIINNEKEINNIENIFLFILIFISFDTFIFSFLYSI
jgi:hypothetical protein